MKSLKNTTPEPNPPAVQETTGKNGATSASDQRDLIEVIIRHLVRGERMAVIVEYLTAKPTECVDSAAAAQYPQLSDTEARRCLAQAIHQIESNSLSQRYKRAVVEAAYWELYKKMVDCGDFNGARATLDKFSELNRLKDCTPTEQKPKRVKPAPSAWDVKAFSLD